MSTTASEADELDVRIPFGPRVNETVPASWASSMLTLLRERNPGLFVTLMGEAAIGYRAEVKSRRNGAG